MQVQTGLAGAPTIAGNNSGLITLTGSATAINTILRAGVRLITNTSYTGNLTIQQFSQVNGSPARTETDTIKLNVVSIPKVLNVPPIASYVENATPTFLARLATFSDTNANTVGGILSIKSTGFFESTDLIAVANQGNGLGQLGVVGNVVKYSGIAVATLQGTGSLLDPLKVSFSSAASAAAVQVVLRRITFKSTSENPTSTPRTLSFCFVNRPGLASAFVTQSLTVVPVNDNPILRINGNIEYLNSSTAFKSVGTGITVSDAEQNYADGKLTVTLTTLNRSTPTFDILSIRTQGNGLKQVSVTGNEIRYSGILIGTWSGNGSSMPLEVIWNSQATSAAIQAVIVRINYRKTSTAPVTTDRTLSFRLSDSTDSLGTQSNLVTRTIRFV